MQSLVKKFKLENAESLDPEVIKVNFKTSGMVASLQIPWVYEGSPGWVEISVIGIPTHGLNWLDTLPVKAYSLRLGNKISSGTVVPAFAAINSAILDEKHVMLVVGKEPHVDTVVVNVTDGAFHKEES